MTMATATPSSLVSIAKSSGRCPPSLLSEDRIIDGGAFELALLRSLDGGRFYFPLFIFNYSTASLRYRQD